MPTLLLRNFVLDDLPLVYTFVGFQLFAAIGHVAMIATALFSKRVLRQPSWINFSFSWLVSALSYCILLFTGEIGAIVPTRGICLTQAALVTAMPPFAATTTLALVIQAWLNVRGVLAIAPSAEATWKALLLAVPYIPFIAMFVTCLALGIKDPSLAQRTGTGMYCNFVNKEPGRIAAISVAMLMIPTIFFEVWIIRSLGKNWSFFRNRRSSLSAIIRIACFTLCGFAAIALALVSFATDDHAAGLNIGISIVPGAAVIIFGSQRDMVRAWMFWRNSKDSELVANQESDSTTNLNAKYDKYSPS